MLGSYANIGQSPESSLKGHQSMTEDDAWPYRHGEIDDRGPGLYLHQSQVLPGTAEFIISAFRIQHH